MNTSFKDGFSMRALVQSMNNTVAGGQEVQLHRKLDNCETEQVETDADFANAEYKLRVAQISKMVKEMTFQEKLAFVEENKLEGNKLYAKEDWDGAVRSYMDAIVGLDLAGSKEQVDQMKALQLPILTNLAVCFLNKKEFVKTKNLCDEALTLDPQSWKALLRRSQANAGLCNFPRAKKDLKKARDLNPDLPGKFQKELQAQMSEHKQHQQDLNFKYRKLMQTEKSKCSEDPSVPPPLEMTRDLASKMRMPPVGPENAMQTAFRYVRACCVVVKTAVFAPPKKKFE